MAKPVVIEVNNKCSCHWNPGITVTLSNQHPDGSAPVSAHAFQCKVLDDRGLYLYVDTRPSGYRFWCTQCKSTEPMSFTYFTDQQTEFIYGMMRRYSQQEDVKKKLEKKIQEITDTLNQERERFETELSEQAAKAENSLSEALSEAHKRDVFYREQEEKWTREEAIRKDFEKKKRQGFECVRKIHDYDFAFNSKDCLGETTRDFTKACEDMTHLVDPLLQVQNKIESCKEQEDRLLLRSPNPSIEKKNEIYLKLLIAILGTEPSSNSVPILQIHPQQQQQPSSEGDPQQQQQQQQQQPPTPLVHIPFDFLASNAATQNIRRLPKANYRLCPNHDVCSQDSSCTYFHLKCIRLHFSRVGEILIPGVFVRDRGDLQSPPQPRVEGISSPDGCVTEGCHCKNRVHLSSKCAPLLFPSWYEREDIWNYCITTTESDDMTNQLDKLKKQRMRFERFLARHPHILGLKKKSQKHFPRRRGMKTVKKYRLKRDHNDDGTKKSDNKKTKKKMEEESSLRDEDNNNNNNNIMSDEYYENNDDYETYYEEEEEEEGMDEEAERSHHDDDDEAQDEEDNEDDDDEDMFETDEEAEEFYPDGTISSLDSCIGTCFEKAFDNMMIEYTRVRNMHMSLCQLDFLFLQLQEYADAIQHFHLQRDLDKLMVEVTKTARECGKLVDTPKPTLGNEGKGFAVGVALIIRETERTFEELANLRDRVDLYKADLEKSQQARKTEAEIELVERQIDLKHREIQRCRKKIELLDAEIEVLVDAEGDDFEAQEKKAERTKTINDLNTKLKELSDLQQSHHQKFEILVDVRDTLVADLDLKDSEQERWRDLLGEGNDALPHSKNLVDFVKNKRAAAAGNTNNSSSPGGNQQHHHLGF